MKVKDFNIQHWQDCLTKFLAICKKKSPPPAIRIENTQFTIKTLEEDAESLVRHRNRAAVDTTSEKMVSYEQEERVPEIAKALCEEKTAQNATGYDTRHRSKGTLAAGLGQRPNRRGESLRQASASSARKQLTTARYYGGMTMNGENYTYFEPIIPGEKPNPDGTPYVAWLMVREDFLRFAQKEAKAME